MKWQPTPVFLPGESQGRGSLVGCRLRGRTELDTTEVTYQQQQHEQLNPHTFDNLDAMDQFLKDTICQNPQKKKIDNLNRPVACCDSWGHKQRTRLSDWTELN